jgi:hypothetical protein
MQGRVLMQPRPVFQTPTTTMDRHKALTGPYYRRIQSQIK